MGQVIEPNGASQRLVLKATDLPADSRIRWIVDGRVTREEAVSALAEPGSTPADPAMIRSELLTTVGDPGFVRVEVWQGGRGLAFTNPIYFQSQTPSSSKASPPLPSCRHQ